jgi:N-acyl-D-aspartate/D-glutamate deacylase
MPSAELGRTIGWLCLFALGWLLPAGAGAADPVGPFDILIRNARVIDGTGRPEFRADVAIRAGRIAAVGQLDKAAAQETLDGTAFILCPGFVDLHNHGDHGILTFRDAENFVRQGATTLVCGNCGSSPTDIAGFLRQLRDGGAGVNIVMLIGHGSVRQQVIGDRNEAPSGEQLPRMRQMVRQAMEAGAVGMSTGLRYRPGAYASTDEVTALAGELAPYGGFYATHMRDEGTKILEALDEALSIGRQAGVPVHISHHKISSASVWGLTTQTLAKIDKARQAGMDVTLDQYPYGAGGSGIALLVPQPAVAGGPEAFRKRIASPDFRKEIIRAVEEELLQKLFEPSKKPDNASATETALARIQLARSPGNKALEGKNLTEVLKERQTPVTLRSGAELIVELVADGASAIYHTIDDRPQGDVERVMRHPQTCIASDGSVFPFGERHPHPRSYGTYPRLLARYVREQKVLSWEAAIHKMTGLPARRLGWTDRGEIKPGYWADIVLLKPDEVRDLATFQTPHRYSVGVEHVIVRGEFVLKSGKMTGQRPGRPILSVPAASTPQSKLRRELLDLLARHDGRFGLYAETPKGRTALAINADDPFPVGPVMGVALSGPTATLRELTGLLVRADKKSLVVRSKAGAAAPHYLLFERLTLADGRVWHVTVAYDKPPADAIDSLAEFLQGPLLKHLREQLQSQE